MLKFKKTLKILKLSKMHAKSAVTLTASEKLSIVGQGFSNEMDCQSLRWGSVTIPFVTWQGYFKVLKTISAEEITIEAENGIIRFHNYQLNSPEIRVSCLDKIPMEIPLNATSMEIIMFPFEHKISYERLRQSAIWNVVKEHMETLKHQLMRAASPLADYGVRKADLAELVAQKLGIIDKDTFLKILFTKE
jgi:hypothetical protein